MPVNVASRLEGANKYYGTTIIASETTVGLTDSTFTWRELDATRVKGRTPPVKINELGAMAGEETPQQREAAAAYARRPRAVAEPRVRGRREMFCARRRFRHSVGGVSETRQRIREPSTGTSLGAGQLIG